MFCTKTKNKKMKKILLIEDDNQIRENITEILELADYKVVTAENGVIGVNQAIKEKPDLILCDIIMPMLDGYGALHLLSKNEETALIPFVFMSSMSEKVDIRKGMNLGADDFVIKPFNCSDLLNVIEVRLKKSALVNDNSIDRGELGNFLSETKGVQLLKEVIDKEDIDTRFYRKKDIIYIDGFFPKGVYYISKGRVKIYKTNELGKELITELYNEGDFFGYSALFGDKKYTDSASTLEESIISMIPREEFLSLLNKNVDVFQKFIKMMSIDIKGKEEQLMKLAFDSVRKRVAEALTTLYNRFKEEEENQFKITISRDDLASLSGTATETTIRMLSDFKDEGLISIDKSSISILDYEHLKCI